MSGNGRFRTEYLHLRSTVRLSGGFERFDDRGLEEVGASHEVGHEHRCGMQVDLLRSVNLLDAARVHDDNAVGHCHGLRLVVRDVDRRDPQSLLHVADLQAHFDAQLGIEVGEGLVEEQHLGAHNHGAGEGDTLLLAARELRWGAFGHGGQVHRSQSHLDGLIHLCCRHLLQLEAVSDVVPH